MAYRIEDDETLSDGLRRCAGEQLDDAVRQLTEGVADDPIIAVHEARKSLKKERALLRLARRGLGEEVYRRESAAFRDAGRRLSAVRDAEVMVETLAELVARTPGRVPKRPLAQVQEELEGRRDAAREHALSTGSAAATVARELVAARGRVGSWPLPERGWALVAPGVRRAYAGGARGRVRAELEPTVERLHDWRKRVKDLWYHSRFLAPLWPELLGVQADQLHVLSERLGDDHDLSVLGDRLRAEPEAFARRAADLDRLHELVDARRRELLADARLLGRRLYAERPKAFARRMEAYGHAHEGERVDSEAIAG